MVFLITCFPCSQRPTSLLGSPSIPSTRHRIISPDPAMANAVDTLCNCCRVLPCRPEHPSSWWPATVDPAPRWLSALSHPGENTLKTCLPFTAPISLSTAGSSALEAASVYHWNFCTYLHFLNHRSCLETVAIFSAHVDASSNAVGSWFPP